MVKDEARDVNRGAELLFKTVLRLFTVLDHHFTSPTLKFDPFNEQVRGLANNLQLQKELSSSAHRQACHSENRRHLLL
jgi:hypothetical protein